MTAVTPSLDVEHARERATMERLSAAPADLSEMTEAAFEDGVRRLKVTQERIQRLLAEVLVEGAHFGNPKSAQGKEAFKRPILLKAGAEELRRMMRLSLHRVEPDEILQSAEYVSVKVTMGIFDTFGRQLAVKSAACTTKEKRFLKFDRSGPTFTDAREELHNCLTMAEKRCGSLLTCEVSGATAFFSNAETMEEALAEDEEVISPWTTEEKQIVYEAAAAAGIGRKGFAALVEKTLGRAQIGTGPDVKALLEAVAAHEADPEPTPAEGEEPAA